ncbi:MAG: 4-alpha-glucanotransferase [Syntrophobacteraceae bacterium]|nr:4-alpha-glucanotransferase [Syntrophobacteraceae bacterium]
MRLRKSGILLHITSLPSEFGIGDLGRGAYDFADFLADSAQTAWQVLPFNPSSPACGNSPYCSFSAFAGNPLLIAPDLLVKQGYLSPEDLNVDSSSNNPFKVDYEQAAVLKNRLLRKAYENFRQTGDRDCAFKNFANANAHWLDDFALFTSLKEQFAGAPWRQWPPEIRDRTEPALGNWTQRLSESIEREKFSQFLFFHQWAALKSYCNQKQIQVIGDIPIYVSHDSSDVWANRRYFKLDGNGRPDFVSGVPPDYFSETGQLWGNPVYCWDSLRETSYAWWLGRIEHNLKYLDMVRLDHFRGFVAYWEVAASEKTAINGRWVNAPATEFFGVLLNRFPSISIIAEDLGIITPEVREIMNMYEFPGMKPLLFAFGGDPATNPYVPHNHVRSCVVYTGTHDNNTVKGWFQNDATQQEKENLCRYFGRELNGNTVSLTLVRAAMMSVASTAIIPMQDFLDLGAEARMNTPSVSFGNWEWRVTADRLSADLSKSIAGLTRTYGRNSR